MEQKVFILTDDANVVQKLQNLLEEGWTVKLMCPMPSCAAVSAGGYAGECPTCAVILERGITK